MIAMAAGTPDDFENLNAFVAAAIKDAFTRPDLTSEQVAENDRIVGIAERTACEPWTTSTAPSSSRRMMGFSPASSSLTAMTRRCRRSIG